VKGYQLIGPLAYQGKKGCQDSRCTHFFVDGAMSEDCFGYHCSYCDSPCSSQGDRCDVSQTILDESRRILEESA
jgi:hypothetical protein